MHQSVKMRYFFSETSSVLSWDPYPVQVDFTPMVASHESGHTLQPAGLFETFHSNPAKRLLENLQLYYFAFKHINERFPPENPIITPHQVVVVERNAVAFSLGVYRKYKELGVDLLPGLSSKEVVKLSDDMLKQREGKKVAKTELKYIKRGTRAV